MPNSSGYKGSLFNGGQQTTQTKQAVSTLDASQIELQATLLVKEHHATCFDAKQLQQILGIGETNAYRLLKGGQITVSNIGGRKLVTAAELARYLVAGGDDG